MCVDTEMMEHVNGKKTHTWSQCPSNKYSKNYNKECNDNGKLILCTVKEFEDTVKFNIEDLLVEDTISDSNNLNEVLNPYDDNFSFSYNTGHYVFANDFNNSN